MRFNGLSEKGRRGNPFAMRKVLYRDGSVIERQGFGKLKREAIRRENS